MQKLSVIIECGRAAVHLVADYRMMQTCGVNPYLVRAPRFEFKAHERILTVAFQHLVVRDRASAATVNSHFFAVFFASRNGLVNRAFVLFEIAVAKSVVYSASGLFLNLRSKALVRLVVFCHDQQSRRVLVESMHDTRANHAVYAAQTVEVVQKRVHERIVFLVRTRLMHHHTLRLVHHRHILVLVHDVERYVFRLDFEHFGLRHFKVHNVTFFEFETAFLPFYAVDKRAVLFDDGFCVRARYAPLGRNENVQSYVVFVNSAHHIRDYSLSAFFSPYVFSAVFSP